MPTKPSLSNGTDQSAGAENEEDARMAVASSPVELKRSSWGQDYMGDDGGGGYIAGLTEGEFINVRCTVR